MQTNAIIAVDVSRSEVLQHEIEHARLFAIAKHGDQRYGNLPYVAHLDDVYRVLVEFGFSDPVLLQAAYLHDVLEDTETDLLDVQRFFGCGVATLVARVTSGSGANRKERNAATYPAIRISRDSIALKLADRIANVRSCIATKDNRLNMYRKEYGDFTRGLHTEHHELAPMWGALDSLMMETTE